MSDLITRRRFLQGAAAAMGALAAGGLIESCSAPPSTSPTAAPAAAPSAAPAAAKAGGTLIAAGDSLGDNYDPSVTFQGWAHSWINANTTETLVDSRTGKVAPQLATSWTVSPDGLTYTFKLRDGVKFHDGTPLDADAVVFNYMRQIDKSHPNYQPLSITNGVTLVGVTKVESSGPLEVKFTRSRPSVGFLAQLALPWAGLLSPTAIKKLGADYGRNPSGTGPFVFEKGAKGAEASMTANPNYWGKKPALDRVVIKAMPDLSTVNAALQAGEIDLTPNVDFKDLAGFRKNSKLKVDVVTGATYGYLAVNNLAPKLTDVRVRRALAYGIDTKNIIDVILFGEGDPPAGTVTPPIPGYAKELVNYYAYDPAKAKSLLTEAGVSDLSLGLWVPNNGFFPAMGELIQAQLAKVGVKTDLQKMDPAQFGGAVTEGKHDLFLWDGSQSSADPAELFNSFFLSSNPRSKLRYGFNNADFDALVAKQDAETDETKRLQIVLQAQKLVLDQVPQIILYNAHYPFVSSAKVQGFKPLPFRHAVYFDTVSLA